MKLVLRWYTESRSLINYLFRYTLAYVLQLWDSHVIILPSLILVGLRQKKKKAKIKTRQLPRLASCWLRPWVIYQLSVKILAICLLSVIINPIQTLQSKKTGKKKHLTAGSLCFHVWLARAMCWWADNAKITKYCCSGIIGIINILFDDFISSSVRSP